MKITTLNLWQVFPINMIKKNTTEDQPENPQVTKFTMHLTVCLILKPLVGEITRKSVPLKITNPICRKKHWCPTLLVWNTASGKNTFFQPVSGETEVPPSGKITAGEPSHPLPQHGVSRKNLS